MTPNKNANKGMPNWIKINGHDQLLGSSECGTESCCWPPTVTAEFWAVMNNVPLSCSLAVWLWTVSLFPHVASHSWPIVWDNLITSLPCSLKKPYQNGRFNCQQQQAQSQITEQHHMTSGLVSSLPSSWSGLDKDNDGGNMEKWFDYQAWGSLCLFTGRIQEE